MEDIAGLVETLLWDNVIGNSDDSYVIAEYFVKALKARGYEIVKVDESHPEAVG